jgi:hypothetical protein
MKRLHAIEDAVHGIAGAVGLGMRKGEFEILGRGLELGEFRQQDFGNIGVCGCPGQQTASALPKLGGVEAVKEMPQVLGQGVMERFIGATALLNPQDHMQKTADHHHRGEEAFPGGLGMLPPIQIHRFRVIVRMMGWLARAMS